MATIRASKVEALRKSRGFTQRALAEAADITRQAVGAIESGRMQPSVGIALALAQALGTTVEALFGAEVSAQPQPARLATATIAGRTVAHPLDEVHLAIEPAAITGRTIFIAGCDISVGLLSRHAMMRSREARALWLCKTNSAALRALTQHEVHAAVVHGESNPAPVGAFAHFHLATTEEGWLVPRGNPLGLRTSRDIVRKKARLVNRPIGSGARDLLDDEFARAKIDAYRIAGYEREVPGPLDAGYAVAYGFADVAIGTASVAQSCSLEFIALREERCTMLVPRAALRTPEIRSLLDALRCASYRHDLEALNAYDVTRTGESLG